MKYYHIIVEKNDSKSKTKNNSKTLYQYNIENEQYIIDRIVMPYVNNQEFSVDGYLVSKEIITRFKIVSTTEKLNVLADRKNDYYSSQGYASWFTEKEVVNDDKLTVNETFYFLDKIDKVEKTENNYKQNFNSKNVFIVHGRDTSKVAELSNFLRKIGLNPIVLFEQPSGGKTIIEKIEEYTGDVTYAICLYTPCDEGHLKDKPQEKRFRARQNVVFEHGYLMAKIGRNRVCALVDNDVETPSDISGILYIPFDNNQKWEFDLAKEMKSAKVDFDFNKVF